MRLIVSFYRTENYQFSEFEYEYFENLNSQLTRRPSFIKLNHENSSNSGQAKNIERWWKSYTFDYAWILLYRKFISTCLSSSYQELSRSYLRLRRIVGRRTTSPTTGHQQRRIQYRDFFPRQRNRAIVKGLSSVATVYMTSDGKGNFFDTWNEVH